MNLRDRWIVVSLAGVALFFAAGGCARLPTNRIAYVGTIERVQEREGDHYSPDKGHLPLTGVYVRLANGPGTSDQQLVVILVMDLYSTARYGDKGDRVSFEKVGRLPLSGELWWDELASYTLLAAKTKPSGRGP